MSSIVTAPSSLAPVATLSQTTPPRRSHFLVRFVPNVLVFGLLLGVFWLGHKTGWKLGKRSDLMHTQTVVDDWCPSHLVPESQCVECKPELWKKPPSFGFCRVHGVTECVLDHPELAQLAGAAQLPKYDTAKAIALFPRAENNSRNTLHQRVVQFASREAAEKAGVDVDVVQERRMSDALSANGELSFDPTRVAHLSSRASGLVFSVFKSLGETVESGDLLALIDAAEVGQAKTHLVNAVVQLQLRRTTLERMRKAASALSGRSISEAETAFKEAEVSLTSARQSLLNLGLPIDEEVHVSDPVQLAREIRFLGIPQTIVAKLPPGTQSSNLFPIRANYPGMIVASDVVAGEVADSNHALFTIADPHRLWLILSLRAEDVRYVSTGMLVDFSTDDGTSSVVGKIAWISPTVDEHTRLVQVRAEVQNTDGHLRDKTFGTGRIVLRNEPNAVVVPREAVQTTADAHFVFVRDKDYFKEGSPKIFHVRQVRLGAQDEAYVELLAGALPGEVIATKGSAMLLAQLLRGSLGAGCGCHQH